MTEKTKINIVWLKRDLRLRDHAPLATAISARLPMLIMYCFEPSLLKSSESDDRHERFVYQSLQDLQQQLRPYNTDLLICHGEVVAVLEQLRDHFQIQNLYAHQETGNKITFDRDIKVKYFCQKNQIIWIETPPDGIIRGAKNRQGWLEGFENYIRSANIEPDLFAMQNVKLPAALRQQLQGKDLPRAFTISDKNFQPGGETYAWRYLHSFFAERVQNYSKHLSKPQLSRKSCSRLSPYITWGNLSARQIYQFAEQYKQSSQLQFHIKNFQSRLWWRSHYIQKLESMWQLEFEPINPGLQGIDRKLDERFEAWATGSTGFPMVDASMRCLQATGWINFRMRAMLATFVTFTLWQDWRAAALHLARLFTDFEPGIHYAQFQMQAGLTGYHPMRIYNPIIQAEQHDSDGDFVRRWIPALERLPAPQIYRPWQMTEMEQVFYACKIGEDYPAPIVDHDQATRIAKHRYWEFRQQPAVQAALPAIWERLCIPKDIERYRAQGYHSSAEHEHPLA